MVRSRAVPNLKHNLEQLRRPLFVIAAVCMLVVVLVELGAEPLLSRIKSAVPPADSPAMAYLDSRDDIDEDAVAEARHDIEQLSGEKPPGVAIRSMAFVDGILLLTVTGMVLTLFVSARVQGKIWPIVLIVAGLLLLIGSFLAIIVLIVLLLLMVSMLLAVPFGTIAYLAIYGSFDRGGASAVLTALLVLKLGFGVLLIMARPRFITEKGLLLLFLTSLVLLPITSFLHGIVPIILVSITDNIAGIVACILGLIWAIVTLVFGIIGAVKALT
jgi:hypothetical protein